ncbi:MAG: DUF4838 domain-containing protein [Phycisphaerae bacterium]
MLKINITFALAAYGACGMLLAICAINTVDGKEDGFILADNGKANADIVLPQRANRIERYAANELQSHIQKATNCKLEIVREDKVTKPFNIYLGDTQMAKENQIETKDLPVNGYRAKITDKAIILAGKDGNGTLPNDDTTPMGTLFAVYNYLNDNVGVRWVWPGEAGTFVPKTAILFSGKALDKTNSPQLIHSRMRDGTGLGPWQNVFSEAEYQKAMLERQVWLRRHQFACGTSFQYGHAFGQYWKRFGETHPDFFALRSDGKRSPSDTEPHLVQMCVSNPELHKQIIQDWVNNQRSYKGPFINGTENDRREENSSCLCDRCKAWDPAGMVYPKEQLLHNNLSDRYARFWLALQKEGEKYNPDATVLGYAYANYSNPPKETKLNSRIIVGIVPPFDYPLDKTNRNNTNDRWKGWSATGASLYLRPNYFLAGYCLPFIFAHQFGDDYKFAYNHGMVATDFDSLTAMFGTQGPNLYMVARLNDNPNMSVEEVLDDYYSTFGKAAPEIKNYFDLWEKLTSKRDNEFMKKYPDGGWNTVGWSGHKLYTISDVEKASEILESAKKLAQGDDDALARVRFLEKGLKHTRLTLETMNVFEEYKANRTDDALKSKFKDALRALDDYRHEIRNDQVVNLPFLIKLEAWRGWQGWRSLKKEEEIK